MADSTNPGPERSTSPTSFEDVKREIARRNEEAQKVARKARTLREQEAIARRRRWEQL